MSIEIEYKYVLKLDEDFYKNILNNIDIACKFEIEQHYLPSGARIRLQDKFLSYTNADEFYVDETLSIFNYKEKRKNGGFIEIETVIESSDYVRLMELATCSLIKTRLVIPTKSHRWEIDLFRKEKDGDCYFCMMECEVSEYFHLSEQKPNIKQLPSIITDNIIYDVELDDSRFSSKKLTDQEYAKSLYDKIIEGTVDDKNELCSM